MDRRRPSRPFIADAHPRPRPEPGTDAPDPAEPRRPLPVASTEATQPRGEHELDLDTEWDADWPSDDDGDWSGCGEDSWDED